MVTTAGGDADASDESVYSGVASKADRVWLRWAAAETRARLRRSVRDMLAVGRVLARARKTLGRDRWRPWLAAEAQVPGRSAYRLLSVARAFGSVAADTLDRFTPTALYALAEPGVPQSIREYAVEQAAGGREVSAAAVREWVEAHRENPDAPLKLASRDAPPDVDPREVWAADNWLTLDNLLTAGGSTVHLSRSVDAENDDVCLSVVYLGPDGRRSATGSTLEQVVLAIAGTGRAKVCPRCPPGVGPKLLDQFSKRKDRPDGRNRYCLQCEAARVRAYSARRKVQPAAAG